MNRIDLQEVRAVVWPKWNNVDDFLIFCKACINMKIRLSNAPHYARITHMDIGEPRHMPQFLTKHDVVIQMEDLNGQQSEIDISGLICADNTFALGVSKKWIRVRNLRNRKFLYVDSDFIEHIRAVLDMEQEKLSVLWACQAHRPPFENPLGRFYLHDLCDFNNLTRIIFNFSGNILKQKVTKHNNQGYKFLQYV